MLIFYSMMMLFRCCSMEIFSSYGQCLDHSLPSEPVLLMARCNFVFAIITMSHLVSICSMYFYLGEWKHNIFKSLSVHRSRVQT
jgi:hypothetical protein